MNNLSNVNIGNIVKIGNKVLLFHADLWTKTALGLCVQNAIFVAYEYMTATLLIK